MPPGCGTPRAGDRATVEDEIEAEAVIDLRGIDQGILAGGAAIVLMIGVPSVHQSSTA